MRLPSMAWGSPRASCGGGGGHHPVPSPRAPPSIARRSTRTPRLVVLARDRHRKRCDLAVASSARHPWALANPPTPLGLFLPFVPFSSEFRDRGNYPDS